MKSKKTTKRASLKSVKPTPRKGRTTPAYPPLDKPQGDGLATEIEQLDGEPAMPFGPRGDRGGAVGASLVYPAAPSGKDEEE